jgi:hypothetical protein
MPSDWRLLHGGLAHPGGAAGRGGDRPPVRASTLQAILRGARFTTRSGNPGQGCRRGLRLLRPGWRARLRDPPRHRRTGLALGLPALPRVALADARGIRITLSHFCPTAAGLLFDDTPLRIVAAPERLSLSGTIEGLDATDALPPLLRPGMLMDFDGCDAWERHAIEKLDAGGPSVDAALDALRRSALKSSAGHPAASRWPAASGAWPAA